MKIAAITLLLALMSMAAITPGSAQTGQEAVDAFPNRPVRIIVPFPAGGPTDIMARILGQKLSDAWKQAVVIENRPGGNTAIAAQAVAMASPDGYTLLAAMDTTMVMNPVISTDLTYDPLKDLSPVTITNKNTSLLLVRSDGPNTAKELIAKGRANPGKLNYGAGTVTTRLAAYLFTKLGGFEAQFIPFRGGAEVASGLLTGSVDFTVDGVAANLALVQSGKLRTLGKLNFSSLPALPDVEPLAVSADLPALGEISTWAGLVAPAATPLVLRQKIYRAVVEAYKDPAVLGRLEKAGINGTTSSPEEFVQFYRSEIDRWSKVFKESGIKLE
jgi:tripartite-type tricarboxylate transporter receptor subunit TctC